MDFDKKTISKLYLVDGLSTHEISKFYNKTVWQIISFMRKNKIPCRKPSETIKLQFERSPLSYNKRSVLSDKETRLLIAGLSLYWAEGSKVGNFTVDFANSNGTMNLIFLKMLRSIYRVDENRLRVYTYCYANQNPLELVSYWSKLLKIPSSQFSKPYVRHDFLESKKDRMPHGLVHIRYSDKRLLKQILSDIDIIAREILD